MPHKIGIITDGKHSYASALISKTSQNFSVFFANISTDDKMFFIPGFYGINEQGEITTFGRGGSDYSAAVVAAAIKADIFLWMKKILTGQLKLSIQIFLNRLLTKQS